MILFRVLMFALVSAALVRPAYACEPETEDCVEVGKWELSLGVGAGVRTNPVEATPDIPLFLLPEVHYTGERFFIQNLDVGFTLWENPAHQLNLFATPSYDQVYFHRWSPSNFFIDASGFAMSSKSMADEETVPAIDVEERTELVAAAPTDIQEPHARDRHTAGLGGVEYIFSGSLADLQFQYLSDFTGVHHGDEARVSLGKYWEAGRHHLFASLGAVWQSSQVINYYYGVTASEADARGTYSTGSAITPTARLDWNYELTERWNLRFLATYRQLPDEIAASPLINDNKVITVFLGGVYHF